MADSQGDIKQKVISHAHTVFWNSLNDKMGCFILLFYFLTVRNVYFHSDFCGCFQRRSTLILCMHFFFFFNFSPSCPEHKMYSRVTDSVGVVSALCSVAHFFFSCAHMQFVKNWQSCSGQKFSSVQIHSMYPWQFSNLYLLQFFLLV